MQGHGATIGAWPFYRVTKGGSRRMVRLRSPLYSLAPHAVEMHFAAGRASAMADALEIDHLTKRYGRTVALDDMTFGLASGELFGFVGSNGAGKTTTMRITMGVLAADSGEVRWQGAPLTLARRRRIDVDVRAEARQDSLIGSDVHGRGRKRSKRSTDRCA